MNFTKMSVIRVKPFAFRSFRGFLLDAALATNNLSPHNHLNETRI